MTITYGTAKPIEKTIFTIRGEKVILDRDLAATYGVATKDLNRAIKRNADRFPADFLFQITMEEVTNLRCQIGTSSSSYGGRRYRPFAFTEQGAIMAANVSSNLHLLRQMQDLLNPPAGPEPPKKEIGFQVRERRAAYRARQKRQIL